jgi:hypothetical protein
LHTSQSFCIAIYRINPIALLGKPDGMTATAAGKVKYLAPFTDKWCMLNYPFRWGSNQIKYSRYKAPHLKQQGTNYAPRFTTF